MIEDLIKVHAVEAVKEEDVLELTAQQKEALDKELAAIAADPALSGTAWPKNFPAITVIAAMNAS